jgi:hypothetical protein
VYKEREQGEERQEERQAERQEKRLAQEAGEERRQEAGEERRQELLSRDSVRPGNVETLPREPWKRPRKRQKRQKRQTYDVYQIGVSHTYFSDSSNLKLKTTTE